jgi:hypothetical protein
MKFMSRTTTYLFFYSLFFEDNKPQAKQSKAKQSKKTYTDTTIDQMRVRSSAKMSINYVFERREPS